MSGSVINEPPYMDGFDIVWKAKCVSNVFGPLPTT